MWVLVALLCRVGASLLAKKAGLTSSGSELTAILANPWYMAELGTLALQAGAWWLALRRLPLSRAYPPLSLSLPMTLAGANILFGENLTMSHAAGASLIVLGVLLCGSAKVPSR